MLRWKKKKKSQENDTPEVALYSHSNCGWQANKLTVQHADRDMLASYVPQHI